jgi:hypothetical protein
MNDSTVAQNQLLHVIDRSTPAEVDNDNQQMRPLRPRTLPCLPSHCRHKSTVAKLFGSISSEHNPES